MKRFTDALIIWTAAGALTFVVRYAWTTRGRWSRTRVGRAVMGLMAVIAVVTSLGVASVFFGSDWPFRDLIRAGVWLLVGSAVWWQVLVMRRVQLDDIDKPKG